MERETAVSRSISYLHPATPNYLHGAKSEAQNLHFVAAARRQNGDFGLRCKMTITTGFQRDLTFSRRNCDSLPLIPYRPKSTHSALITHARCFFEIHSRPKPWHE